MSAGQGFHANDAGVSDVELLQYCLTKRGGNYDAQSPEEAIVADGDLELTNGELLKRRRDGTS